MRLKTKRFIKKRENLLPRRKKYCRFCKDNVKSIDYKDIRLLESFVKERGKVISRRASGNCARHQRRIAEAVKRARFLSLVPYTHVVS